MKDDRIQNEATIGFVSFSKPLSYLSDILKITPTDSFNIGDTFSTRTGPGIRDRSVWRFTTGRELQSEDTTEHILLLLRYCEPVLEEIATLQRDPDITVFTRLDIGLPTCFGGISVDADLMAQLAEISDRMDLSFWGLCDDEKAEET